MKSLISLSVLAAFAVAACTAASSATPAPEPVATSVAARPTARIVTSEETVFRLVAIGDSFAHGQGVARRDSWPNQLVAVLGNDMRLELVANLAETSKTSQDVIDEQLDRVSAYRPDVVMLQVGANDVHSRDVAPAEYRSNVALILETLLAELRPDRVFVVTTPDYTLTARGAAWADREILSAAVAEVNVILTEEAERRAVRVIDISPVSRRVSEDRSLVAPNGQDPSEKQYAGWVELIAPIVRVALAEGES